MLAEAKGVGLIDGVDEIEGDIVELSIVVSLFKRGATSSIYFALSQTKYPAITTRVKIITTIVTFLPICAILHKTNSSYKGSGVLFLLTKNALANKPLASPNNAPPITSENQCSPR